MILETMRPDDTEASPADESAIKTFRAVKDELTIRVWGGDWCGDCQAVLPAFAAALEAAGIDPRSVKQYPVEKSADGSKIGPGVEEYDIAYIPTVVVEREGEEVARFVESEEDSIIVHLAAGLSSKKSVK